MTARVIPRVAALLLCLSWCGCASTRPGADGARVVWARADRVYVASSDSLAAAEGDSLAFVAHGRTVAAGVVTDVLDGGLAAVRVTSGSLGGVGKLEQVGVVERPRPVQVPRTLRVGAPGPSRPNLLFTCLEPLIGDSARGGFLAREVLGGGHYRLILVPNYYYGPTAPFRPDTILVRLFDESTDEEIALERGELDVGVFWPGELSAHMRQDARWRPDLSAARPVGRVFAIQGLDPGPDAGAARWRAVRRNLVSLNDDLFRGDLNPSPTLRDSPTASGAREMAPESGSVRFEVDRSCPGWEVMERYLNRGSDPSATADGSRRIRLAYVGESRPSPGGDAHGVVEVFEVVCPIVCLPGLRPYLSPMGPMLRDVLQCPPTRADR